MATYKSEEVTLHTSAENVFGKLSNLENLSELIKKAPADQIPADKMELLNQVKSTADTISFPGGPVGQVVLRRTEALEPTLIRMEGQGTPVPMSVSLHISPILPEECKICVEIDLQIPAMLKPMVNGPMKNMTEQFAQMFRAINFA